MAWLGTYAKRRKITIDHTKFSADLTWFPLKLNLNGSDYGGNLSDLHEDIYGSPLKIAVTKADGTTQLYVEIEYFGTMGPGFGSSGMMVVWVSKSDWVISSTVDTDIYLYWDVAASNNTTFVGRYCGDRTEVWDSNFATVHHMVANGLVGAYQDSTANNLDPTLSGGPTSNGTSLGFDGVDDVYSIPDSTVYNTPRSGLTVEMFVQEKASTQYRCFMAKGAWGSTTMHFYNDNPFVAGKIQQAGGTFNTVAFDSTSQSWIVTPDSNFHYICMEASVAGNGYGYFWVDGAFDTQDSYANGLTDIANADPITLGSANGSNFNNCAIEEFRLSINARPSTYVTATNATLKGLTQTINPTTETLSAPVPAPPIRQPMRAPFIRASVM